MQFSADLRSLYSVLVAAIISLNVAPVFAATRSYTLEISNADVAPDGFTRGAVIVNGNYRAPLLTADKVQMILTELPHNSHVTSGGYLRGCNRKQLGRPWYARRYFNCKSLEILVFISFKISHISIGTVYSNRTRLGRMVQLASPSVPSLLSPATRMILTFRMRQAPSGTTLTWVGFQVVRTSVSMLLKLSVGVQYCDGLRGPIVVYDPSDPHAALYDEDDGKHGVFCQ